MKLSKKLNPFFTFAEKYGAFIATLILSVIAYSQFQKLNTISSADFIYKLSDTMFTGKTRIILELIDKNSLKYNKSDYTFAIEKNALKDKSLYLAIKNAFGYDKTVFSCYEIDDLLLSNFEDLGLLEQKGIVDIDMAYVLFDWPVEVTWDNKEIQKYIQVSREEDGRDVYDKYEDIFNKFISLKREIKIHDSKVGRK